MTTTDARLARWPVVARRYARMVAQERADRITDQWRRTNAAVIEHWNRADAAEARVERVTALADKWNSTPDYDPTDYDRGRVDQRHAMTTELLEALSAP